MGKEADQLRQIVTSLFLKGYNQDKILEDLQTKGYEVSPATLGVALRKVKRQLHKKKTEAIEYRKRKYLKALDEIRSDAWDLRQKFANQPSACFASHRVNISALELQAKIDGVISEKLTVVPDAEIIKLKKELKETEERALVLREKELALRNIPGEFVNAFPDNERTDIPENRIHPEP